MLFGAVMLESMGVAVPGEAAPVTTARYVRSRHHVGVIPVKIVAAWAAIIGDNIGYQIGRTIGLQVMVRYGRHIGLTDARLKLGQYLFLRHGAKIVFFERFVAFLRTFAAVLARANRMPWLHL